MTTMDDKTKELLELANHYPSPHNGQPIELKQLKDNVFELYFRKERGLQAAEVSLLFSYVTMGVFIEHLELCAKALGHKITHKIELPPVEEIQGAGLLKFGQLQIDLDKGQPDKSTLKTLLFRQTSRKKYTSGIDEALARKAVDIATEYKMQLIKMDRKGTHQAIWLNQRAVFDDMFDDAVRKELNHWLRYSKQEKEEKKDGLAYDCMELNGRVMKFIIKHYKLLRAPGIGNLLKQYYLRTMADKSDVFYLLTPFSTEKEAFDVGTVVMRIWGTIAAEGYYLHPFGTIMSNQAAHKDFLKLAGIEHEDIRKNFLVFIYRAGRSPKPNASLRIPINQHLVKLEDV